MLADHELKKNSLRFFIYKRGDGRFGSFVKWAQQSSIVLHNRDPISWT